MREILFRGKRTDNGEWVEGYLVKFGKESFCDNDRYGIMEDTTLIAKVVTDNKGSSLIMRECEYVYHNVKVTEVIPETVGEYTGLTDKNNKAIFEGDIVSVIKSPYYTKYDSRNLVIRFDEYHRFIASGMLEHPLIDSYEWEIIGNIHDNPELLKGGGQND